MQLWKESEISNLLKLSSVPDFLKENLVYKSDNPLDFFIGFIDKSTKVIEREVTLVTPGISLPIIQNMKIVRNFTVKNDLYTGKEPIVIILSDLIEFIDQDRNSVPRVILGIFKLEDLDNVLSNDYENKLSEFRDDL